MNKPLFFIKSSWIRSLVIAAIALSGLTTQGIAQKGITTIGAKKFLKKISKPHSIQLIDVRTVEEFREGHIGDAVNYNVLDSTLYFNMGSLDKKKPVYVYCRSGVRSMKAAKLLKSNGFRVFNLNKGITGWQEKNFSVEVE